MGAAAQNTPTTYNCTTIFVGNNHLAYCYRDYMHQSYQHSLQTLKTCNN